MVRAWVKRLKAYFWDVAAIKTHPHEIALGFAIGVFISTMPTPGFNFILAFITLFFIRMNKIALLAGLAFINPFLTPLIYSTALQIGRIFIPYIPLAGVPWHSWENLLANVKPFILGALILAIWFAVVSYAIVFLAAYFYQMRKHKGLHPRSPPRAPMFYRLRDAGKYTTQVSVSTVRRGTHLVRTTSKAGVETVKKGARAVTPVLKTTGRMGVETVKRGGRVVAPLLRKREKKAKQMNETKGL